MSKPYLVLDSCSDFLLALLNDQFEMVDHFFIPGLKTSRHVHQQINTLLNRNCIKPVELASFIVSSGPGSYTGVRLGQGIASLFDWYKINTCHYYAFEVPRMLGYKEGLWFSNAYKSEYFYFYWNDEENIEEFQLCHHSNFTQLLKTSFENVPLFTQGNWEHELSLDVVNTLDMCMQNPQNIYSQVVRNNKKLEPFYYREDGQEFKLAKKQEKR